VEDRCLKNIDTDKVHILFFDYILFIGCL
jgi:hypothetical protein